MHWLEPNNFEFHVILKVKQHLYLKNQNLWRLFVVVKAAELIQARHCRIGEAIKTKF